MKTKIEFPTKNSLALYNLGLMYLRGCPPDIAINTIKAIVLFREALPNKLAESELRTLQGKYQTNNLIQYQCIMAFEPEENINKFFKPEEIGEYIIDDSLLTSEKKYLLFKDRLFQSDQIKLISYALSAPDAVRNFIVKHMIEESISNERIGIVIPTIPEAAALFRKSYNSSNEQIKYKLQSIQKEYPGNNFVQYHCMMAIEPHLLNDFFDRSSHDIAESILDDIVLTETEKSQVFLEKLFESNWEKMASYALSAPERVRQFIARHIFNMTNPALQLRKSYALSAVQAQSQLRLLKNEYPNQYLVQYNCVMTLESRPIKELFNKSKLVENYIFEDILLTKEEKYKVFSEEIFEFNPQKLATYALSAPEKIRNLILEQTLKGYSENVVQAATALRNSFSKLAEYKLQVLQGLFPQDYTVQYHCVMGLEPQFILNLFEKSPAIIGNCIFNDPDLTDKEKGQLFLDIFQNKPKELYSFILSDSTSAKARQFIDKQITEKFYENNKLAQLKVKEIQNQDELQNDSNILFHLGVVYQHGQGVPMDPVKAAFFFRKSYSLSCNEYALFKLHLLKNQYPHNYAVQYESVVVIEPKLLDNVLLVRWPKEISACMFNDKILTDESKYHLFLDINMNSLEKFISPSLFKKIKEFIAEHDRKDTNEHIVEEILLMDEYDQYYAANVYLPNVYENLKKTANEHQVIESKISNHDDFCDDSYDDNPEITLTQYDDSEAEQEDDTIELEQRPQLKATNDNSSDINSSLHFFKCPNSNASKQVNNAQQPKDQLVISNLTFEFKKGAENILLIISSEEGELERLPISSQNKEDIHICKNLTSVAKILSKTTNGEEIANIIMLYNDGDCNSPVCG